jgi:uncharacterized protein YjbJ (UPF0337 family)
MDWNRIAGNWIHWRARVQQRWGRLSHDELDRVAGQREQLLGRIQAAYGLGRKEAERQLRNWERGLSLEGYDEADPASDDEPGSQDVN